MNNAKEDFIRKDEEGMAKSIDILKGEDKLIETGLLEKSKEELIKIAENMDGYKENLTKEQLINIITSNLNDK